MNKICILGMGPGHRDYILPVTLRIIDESDVLIGGKRILKDFVDKGKELVYIDSSLSKIIHFIDENKNEKKISLLLSGDTGFYSMLSYMKKHFSDEELKVVPGISSFQYLMGKVNRAWQDSFVGSVHGRELDIVSVVKKYDSVILLTDNKYSPSRIADILIGEGINNRIMIVGENLSYDNERIIIDTCENISSMKNIGMSVVVIEKNEGLGI